MKNIFFILTVFSLALVSCDKKAEPIKQSHTFENNRWHRFDKLYFDLPVADSIGEYDINVEFVVDESFLYKKNPCHFIMNLPNGEERIKTVQMGFKDNNDKLLRGSFDEKTKLSTVKITLWKQMIFTKKGNVKIEVESLIPKWETFGIHSFSMMIEQTNKD